MNGAWEQLEPAVLRSLVYRFIQSGEQYPLHSRAPWRHLERWHLQVYAGLLAPLPGWAALNPILHAGNLGGPAVLCCTACHRTTQLPAVPLHFLQPACAVCATTATWVPYAPTSFSALAIYWRPEYKQELAQYLQQHNYIGASQHG